jgi:Tfp pilus assembly protein PilN
MIKINLLPQKRAKQRAGAATTSDTAGTKHFMIGVGALLGAAALVFVLFDLPRRSERSDYETKNKQLTDEINAKKKKLEGYESLKAEEAAALEKIQGINRLNSTKVVPANVLHELSQILSLVQSEGQPKCKINQQVFNGCPSMTAAMRTAVETDPNKKIQPDWDPTHVWLQGWHDIKGAFTLEGGAQSKEDVTQLSKRLAASVYFENVTPQSGDRVTDTDTGLSYYKFTITGKVAY